MRLTLRLLVLVLLIGIATFTNLVSPVSHASQCQDGCYRGYEYCMGANPPNQQYCSDKLTTCLNGCQGH
ncbi:MAG: hypothetical protein QOD33_955 [Pyrinomonadaceae bacterium]|jgi:hypothetical protein|nr:hypothetical protein [Pyrinomonadaceae bacterium]